MMASEPATAVGHGDAEDVVREKEAKQDAFDRGYRSVVNALETISAEDVRRAAQQVDEVGAAAARPRPTAPTMRGRLPVVQDASGAWCVAITPSGLLWEQTDDEEAHEISRLHAALVDADVALAAAGNDDAARTIHAALRAEATGGQPFTIPPAQLRTLEEAFGQGALQRAADELLGDYTSAYTRFGAPETNISANLLNGTLARWICLPLPGWIALAQVADVRLVLAVGARHGFPVPQCVRWPEGARVVSLDKLRRTAPSDGARTVALALVAGAWAYALRAPPAADRVQYLELTAAASAAEPARRHRGPPPMPPRARVHGRGTGDDGDDDEGGDDNGGAAAGGNDVGGADGRRRCARAHTLPRGRGRPSRRSRCTG